MGTIYRGIYPHLAGMALILLVLLLFPQISLWLPAVFMP